MRYTYVLILLFLLSFAGNAQNDCPDAIIVCGDANYYDLEAEGRGRVSEITANNACFSGENNSIWLKIQINQGGTLGFILTPEGNDLVIDFDFWLFGPIEQCGAIGSALRCSTTNPLQANLDYITTGMNDTETDTSEGPGPDGNAFVQWITVQDNEFYYLVVDRPHGYGNFSLQWTGTATFHTVPVFLNPNNIPLDMAQCDKDGVNDGSTEFDLTVYEDMFIGAQNPMAVTYYDDMNGAITGQDPILEPEAYANVSNPQTIYLRMTNTVTGCYSTHSYNIAITPPMRAGLPDDLFACDVNQNGITQFNLALNDANVRGSNDPSTIVSYYTSAQEALLGDNPIGPLYTNTTPYSQTVYSRVEDANGCFSYVFNPFTISTSPLPIFNTQNDVSLNVAQYDTDGINDRISLFDLTTHEAALTGSQLNTTITYHLSQDDANTGNNPIATPQAYPNISDPQTIYMRMFSSETECFDTLSFEIRILRVPMLLPPPLELCDINENGVRLFDLTANDDNIKYSPTDVVTYYLTEADALADTNRIGSFYQNAVAYQDEIIWARLEKNSGNPVGYGVTSFTIHVIPLPQINNPDNISFDQSKCDQDGVDDISTGFDLTIHEGIMIGIQNNVSVSYYETADDAEAGTNVIGNPLDYHNTASPHTIYFRLYNSVTGCYKTGSFQLSILPTTHIGTLPPLVTCDDNNDTFSDFNLDALLQQIEADFSANNAVATIYETYSDAFLGVNVIPDTNPYTNIEPATQTLYVRIVSTFGCFNIVPVQLVVNPRPEPLAPAQPYALCDNGDNDTDGLALFDLTTLTSSILDGMDPALYTVTYETTDGTVITATGSYLSPTATIVARVTNNATGCTYTVLIQLRVDQLPVLITNEYIYSLCDVTAPTDDRIEVFDLTTAISQFITDADVNGIAVTFYRNLADANAATNPIADPENYQNSSVPAVESLFVRFTNTVTGCYRLGYLDVRVEPLPEIVVPTAIELTVCDTNGAGTGLFNLDALKDGMRNGGTNLAISFHLTLEDASTGFNAIPNETNYKNGNPYTETLYVRVVNTVTGCFNTYAITLHVNPAPQAPDLADITLCDDMDNNGQDGAAKTDITLYEDDIAAAVDPVDVDITYYTSEADANTPVRAIANPATYTAHDNQVIWVRVEDAAGCYSVTSFTIHFNKPHALVNPTPLALCNELLPNDGITSFDLTQKDDEILGAAGVGRGYTVEYFTANPKGNTGAVAIPDPKAFTNTTNPQVIYVRVTTKAGCVSYTSLSIKVLPLPEPNFNPAPLVLCDDDQATVGSEPFDLTDAGDDILANGDYELSYYETEEDANNKVNPIPDPTSYTSTGGVVYVRVEANTNNPAEPGCYQVVALTLRVDPLPPVSNIPAYGICNDSPLSPTLFNLRDYVEKHIGGNSNELYTINYYKDAALTTPAIPITAYVVTGQYTVYIEVINNETGCRIVKELRLIVEQEAVANPVTDFSPVCDIEGDNDGIITWNLTPLGAQALGTQDPTQFTVTYYDLDPLSEPVPVPIADPSNYANVNPGVQQIWIVITNSASIQPVPCYDSTTTTLLVEKRPDPVIATDMGNNTICIDWGESEGELLLESGIIPDGHTFAWYKNGVLLADSDQSGTYMANTGGLYTVVVTGPAPLNCVSDESEAFRVIESGQASQIGKGYYVTNYFSDDQTVTITVEGNGDYVYQLDNGPKQESNVFTNVPPGYHTVTIYDVKTNFPCKKLEIGGVTIVDYPNFFTPNGDGFNDTWNIIGLDQRDAVIYIFDRYGKLLKQISAVGAGWDGTFNGEALPSTDYWFTVQYHEFDGTTLVTREFKAHFSLKR